MSAMLIDVRPLELLYLWSELDDAYHGQSRFGGDTAELYAYRFDTFSPRRHAARAVTLADAELEAEAANERAERLFALLTLFSKQRDVRVTVNGRRLGRWLLTADFSHRVHVTVIHPKERTR